MLFFTIGLAVVFLGSLIAFFAINNKSREIKNSKVLLFTLLFAVVISATGFSGLISGVADSMLWFMLLQAVFLGVGYLAWFLLKKGFWGEFEKEKTTKVLFVVMNAALGMIGFTLLFSKFNSSTLAPYYSLAVTTFLLPQCIDTLFRMYAGIPQEIYKVWYFPVHAEDVDFDKIDTSNVYMLELEYSRSVADGRTINTKARAPLGMKFGDWFRLYIEDYNERNDNDPVHLRNHDGTSQGWTFSVKPSLLGTAKFIDPDLSIADNKISEKHKIIAKRVEVIYN